MCICVDCVKRDGVKRQQNLVSVPLGYLSITVVAIEFIIKIKVPYSIKIKVKVVFTINTDNDNYNNDNYNSFRTSTICRKLRNLYDLSLISPGPITLPGRESTVSNKRSRSIEDHLFSSRVEITRLYLKKNKSGYILPCICVDCMKRDAVKGQQNLVSLL